MIFHKRYFATLGAALSLTLSAAVVEAQITQNQQPSVAEASRRAREKQKQQRPAAKVYTNESLGQIKGDISVVGPPPASAPANSAVPENGATPDKSDKPAGAEKPGAASNSSNPANDEAAWRKKFADLRKTMAADAKELDVLQREFNLKQEQYYSNPNVALREQYSRGDLDATEAKIDAKKQDIEKDNQALLDLEDALRKSGGDPGWSREQR